MSASAPEEPQRTALQVVSAELRQIEGLGRKEWRSATPTERLALLQRVCDTVTIGHGLTSIAVTSEPLTGTRRSEYDQHRRAICLDGAVLVDGYLRKTAVKAVLRQSRRAAQIEARLAADAKQDLPVEQERLARLASHDPQSDHINVSEYDANSFSRGVLRRDARFRGAVATPPGVIPAGIGAISAGGAVLLAALALGGGADNVGPGSTTPHHNGTQHTNTQNPSRSRPGTLGPAVTEVALTKREYLQKKGDPLRTVDALIDNGGNHPIPIVVRVTETYLNANGKEVLATHPLPAYDLTGETYDGSGNNGTPCRVVIPSSGATPTDLACGYVSPNDNQAVYMTVKSGLHQSWRISLPNFPHVPQGTTATVHYDPEVG